MNNDRYKLSKSNRIDDSTDNRMEDITDDLIISSNE